MADVRLDDLDPALAEKYQPFVDGCAAEGFTVRIIQGWRDPAYQDQLHAQGISPLTGKTSLHCCTCNGNPAARAFDFGVFDASGTYITDGKDWRYLVAGQVAESLGLISGGNFSRADPDHVQLPANDGGNVVAMSK